MNTLTNLLTSLIIGAWISAIAVFSVQNFEPVSLKFLFFESIQLPVGVLLAFSAAIGAILGALIPLWGNPPSSRQRRRGQQTQERDFLEDDILESWQEESSLNW